MRHGSNSTFGRKSTFNPSFDIKGGIESTLKGSNFLLKPNTAGRARETYNQLTNKGLLYQADISDEMQVKGMVHACIEKFGKLDYLVNNAGITHQLAMDDFEGATDEVWDKLWDVNVKGTFHCIKEAVPYLKKSTDAAIVNVGSVAGITGLGSSVPYAVTKSAVHGLTKSLAFSLAPKVRINSIVPGAVDTRWWKGNEEKMKAMAGRILLKRISTPEDIAEAICCALVQKSLTGQVITVDNGQTL
ncbi:SDR family oxidoreductase [Sporolactobacillus shoreicorticis]|uniref:SDR family NAD(P)-dependent oxidoreductase n=1 Tax=Sporolactobacillus shoreicorticis TaxID=1923877 RepID=A0ABW5S1Y7_9BACL|nr:SDR family oxidoreductase [Sporolactobacillus shoreicorticis]MCO7125429.1 SDR family oxidoreductase [Sporolactobacillus shoreicorticis]